MPDPQNTRHETWFATGSAIQAHAKNTVATDASPVLITSQELQPLSVDSLWRRLQWRWLTESSGPLPKEQNSLTEQRGSKPIVVRVPQGVFSGIATLTGDSLIDKLQNGPKQRIQELLKSSK